MVVLKTSDIHNREHETSPINAKRIVRVDGSGNTLGDGPVVTNAIDNTAFDLNGAAFSETTNLSNDYIFDSVLLNFSTPESKTITITGQDGTILLGGTVDTTAANLLRNTTGKHFNLIFKQAMNGGDNITVDVTQYSSAGTMDCILKVTEGTAFLSSGNPVLGAGTNLIGSARREPETSGNPLVFEDVAFVVGESPVSLDVRAALGRNATQFSIINDGAGTFTVATSNDGVSFGGEKTVKNGEEYALNNYSLDTMRITHVTDSSYRAVMI